MLDVLELLPFENAVTTFDATGAELLRTAREQAVAQGLEKHGALEMSGMTVSYRQQGADAKLVEARIGAAPIDSAKIYRVVTIDYVAVSQPERYLGFAPRGLETTTSLLSDVITEEIMAAKSPLRADSAQRLFEVQ